METSFGGVVLSEDAPRRPVAAGREIEPIQLGVSQLAALMSREREVRNPCGIGSHQPCLSEGSRPRRAEHGLGSDPHVGVGGYPTTTCGVSQEVWAARAHALSTTSGRVAGLIGKVQTQAFNPQPSLERCRSGAGVSPDSRLGPALAEVLSTIDRSP